MQIKIYHNPKCSKSRTALTMLANHNIDIKIFLYLSKPINKIEILSIIKKLNNNNTEILRTKESEYDAKYKKYNTEQLANLIIAQPKLLQRPIIIYGDTVIIGRDEDKIKNLLNLNKHNCNINNS